MRFNTFVISKEDIDACRAAPQLEEVLLEPRELAREGRLSFEQVESLAREARAAGLKPVLVWDILMTNDEYKVKSERVRELQLDLFSAIRTQCPGAARWVRENVAGMPLQIIVENSNHNMPGLKRWVAALKPERVVLSTQLPEDRLIECCQELGTECEILGAGKILLFYSKRQLLHTQVGESDETVDNRWIYADSASEESASRPFPTVENAHGTFMFLNKDHFILDKLEKLDAGGMSTVRIDLRDLQDDSCAARGIAELCRMSLERDSALESAWSRPTSAPFFKRNRTDKQFARMKPHTRLLRDDNCLAEVVSVERGEELGLFALRAFDASQVTDYAFVLSDGREVPVTIEVLRDLSGEPTVRCEPYKLLRCRYVKGVPAGALLVRRG
jgi:putative protease